MYEPQYYDSPPVYSPPYSTTSQGFYPPRSVHSPQSQYVPYTYNVPPDSYYMEETPQHFYRWFSPPGFVKTFQGATVLMCFLIFACVASTLVWDMNGFGYGGYGFGAAGAVTGMDFGYHGGSYGYSSSYMTPHSAKSAMISMAAICFLVSLGFLVGSFSRSRMMRGCRFYLTVFICDIILAVLQVSFTKYKMCQSIHDHTQSNMLQSGVGHEGGNSSSDSHCKRKRVGVFPVHRRDTVLTQNKYLVVLPSAVLSPISAPSMVLIQLLNKDLILTV